MIIPCRTLGQTDRDLRQAYASFIAAQGFTFGITLNWNQEKTLGRARQDLRLLFRDVDRKMLGSRFNRRAESLRAQGIFAYEHVQSNIHAHGLFKVAPGRNDVVGKLFDGERPVLWTNIVPSGTICLQSAERPIAAAIYMLKEQRLADGADTLVWLSEFLPTGN